MKTKFVIIIMLFVYNIPFSIDINTIIDKVDKLYRSKTAYAKIEMNIETPHWKRTLEMEMWSEGLEKTFIRINKPKKDKGIATLKINREMWNFFPKINKVMKIPPSMMMGNWMGSDFTNDDLVKESTFKEDYDAKLLPKTNKEFYYVEFTPKKTTATVWGKIIIKVSKDFIPIYEEFFDEKGEKVRIMNFKEIKQLGGKRIPTILELLPLKKKGHKTIIKYIDAKFDIKFKKNIFTLRNLQRRTH